MRHDHLLSALLCAELRPPFRGSAPRSRGRGGRESGGQYRLYHDRRPCLSDRRRLRHPISRLAPTPNIDRWRAKGCIFREAFVENSISAPSRPTLLTGVYSHRHGQTTPQLRHYGYRRWCISPNCSGRGLPDGDLRQMAPERANPRASIITTCCGIRGVLQSGDAHAPKPAAWYVRQEGYATDIITTTLWRGSTRAGTTTRLSA